MASLVDAVPQQVNGLAEPSPQSPPSPQSQSQQPQSDSSQSAVSAPAKRKRESSDDGSAELNDDAADHEAKPVVNGDHPVRNEATLIRNYFDVIQRYATAFYHPSL